MSNSVLLEAADHVAQFDCTSQISWSQWKVQAADPGLNVWIQQPGGAQQHCWGGISFPGVSHSLSHMSWECCVPPRPHDDGNATKQERIFALACALLPSASPNRRGHLTIILI